MIRDEMMKTNEQKDKADSAKRKSRNSDGENTPINRMRPNGTTPNKDTEIKTKIPSPLQRSNNTNRVNKTQVKKNNRVITPCYSLSYCPTARLTFLSCIQW